MVQEGGRYSGRGSMHLIFPLGQGKSDVLVDLAFADWRAPDGSVVIEGTLDQPNPRPGEFGAHGMLVKLERLWGAAGPGSNLNLDLAARLPDGLFTLKSPPWQASAAISAAGDWIAEAGGFGPAPIGYSSFTLESTKVTIDLSEAENKREPGAYCLEGQPAGPGWMGLHFGNATIVPDTFSLFPAYQYHAQDWAVGADGVCGQATMTGGFGRRNYKDGELGFDGIDLRVQNGYVKAAYQGFYARVPPLYDAEFSGAPVFTDAPGAVPFVSWDKVAGPAQVEHTMSTPSGRITARSVNFRFGSFPGAGWGVRSDTAFSFEANHQPFVADVWVNGLVNSFDGTLSLEDGGTSADIALGAGTVLGQTPMTLDAVHVGGFGGGELSFAFAAKVRISSKLSENPLPVGFVLERKTYSYGMRGPLTQSFVQRSVPETRHDDDFALQASGTYRYRVRALGYDNQESRNSRRRGWPRSSNAARTTAPGWW